MNTYFPLVLCFVILACHTIPCTTAPSNAPPILPYRTTPSLSGTDHAIAFLPYLTPSLRDEPDTAQPVRSCLIARHLEQPERTAVRLLRPPFADAASEARCATQADYFLLAYHIREELDAQHCAP